MMKFAASSSKKISIHEIFRVKFSLGLSCLCPLFSFVPFQVCRWFCVSTNAKNLRRSTNCFFFLFSSVSSCSLVFGLLAPLLMHADEKILTKYSERSWR